MPPEEAAADTGGFDVAAFIAANPPDATPVPEPVAVDPTDPEGEQPSAAEAAFLASLDADETPAATDDDAEEEPAAEDEPTGEPAKALDVKAIEAALKAKNPEAFLAALGDDAEHVLGTKAHRTLRVAARDVKLARAGLLKASGELREKFGDPAAVRAAADRQDADAVVEGVEKFFGASWESLVKFVNASFAGKPERLEKKAQTKAAETAAADTKKSDEAAEQTARQAAATTQLKTTIADVVKKQQPALAGFPAITDLVFEKLKAGYQKGVNTPAKALAAVLVDLRAQHAELTKAFAPPAKKSSKTAPPPRETGKRGREMTEEELIADFLANNRP